MPNLEVPQLPALPKFDGSETGHIVAAGNSRGYDVQQLKLFFAAPTADWRDGCRVAATANIDLALDLENGDTIDGIVLSTGDRVLVKDQATTSQNGVYVAVASGAASRATDFDADVEVDPGAAFYVFEGTANARKAYEVTSSDPHVVDTDPITFAEFAPALGGAVSVEEGGAQKLAAASILNFIGPTVTDAGAGQADITVSGGGSGGALEFISKHTLAAATTDFNLVSDLGLQSGDVLMVVLEDVRAATDDSAVGVNLKRSGQGSFDIGATDYTAAYGSNSTGSMQDGGGNALNMLFNSYSAAEQLGNDTDESISGIAYLYNLQDAVKTKSRADMTWEWPSGDPSYGWVSVRHNFAEVVTDIQFYGESSLTGVIKFYKLTETLGGAGVLEDFATDTVSAVTEVVKDLSADFNLGEDDVLLLEMEDVTVSVDDVSFGVQVSNDNQTSWETGGVYEYASQTHFGTAQLSAGTASTSMWLVSGSANEKPGNAAGEIISGEARIVGLVSPTRIVQMDTIARYRVPAGTLARNDVCAEYPTAEAITDIRVLTGSGTFSGIFRWRALRGA